MIDIKRVLTAQRVRAAAATRRICFVHVPKCAGTSVSWAIRRQAFGMREQMLLKDFGYDAHAGLRAAEFAERSVWTLAPEILAYHLASSTHKFAGGHVHAPPRLVDSFSDRWSFITVLREPVDRLISAYVYDTFKPSDHFKNTLDIEEYLHHERGLWNGVMYLFYFSDLMYEDNPFEADHAHYAQQAIENLKNFRLVGAIEKFDDWIAGFRDAFGTALKVERSNASPRSEAVERIRSDESLMTRIRRICEPDTEVYRRLVG